MIEKESIIMVDGMFIKTIYIPYKPEPLSGKIDSRGSSEAGRYYNKKYKEAFPDLDHKQVDDIYDFSLKVNIAFKAARRKTALMLKREVIKLRGVA